jgi:hypothetical protein
MQLTSKGNHNMKPLKIIVILISLLASYFSFAATKAENKVVELKYEVKKNKSKQKASSSTLQRKKRAEAEAQSAAQYTCNVSIAPFLDARENKQTLGSTWSLPLIPNDVAAWLESIRKDDLLAKTKRWNGSKNLELKPKVKKLYSYAESMNIHGVVSLEVEYWVDGKLEKTTYYRGMGSKANMMNALNEYGVALNYGVHEVIPRIIADAKSFCTN